MGLGEIVRDVERRAKALTVYNPDPDDPIVDEIAAFFGDRAVEVCADATPSGRPSDVAVLEVDGSVLSIVALETLRDVVEREPVGADQVGVDDRSYRHVLDHVEEATFTSSSPQRMLATAHEFEDRAFRVGSGTLYAGFQLANNVVPQADRYSRIADSGVDVSIYVSPSESLPRLPAVDVHQLAHPDVRDFWVVAFDGGRDRRQQCALVAEERAPDQYAGFWTYDPDVVDRVVDALLALEDRVSP